MNGLIKTMKILFATKPSYYEILHTCKPCFFLTFNNDFCGLLYSILKTVWYTGHIRRPIFDLSIQLFVYACDVCVKGFGIQLTLKFLAARQENLTSITCSNYS